MKHIIRKAYIDYEKEEKWLNDMSAKGLALTHYSWCKYVFEDAKKGEYIYRIELLKNLASHPESLKYIQFLEENNVECVATYFRWIYLRQKASDGEFEIYTDIDSKYKHYKTIFTFWTMLSFLEFFAGIINIYTGVTNYLRFSNYIGLLNINIIFGILLIMLGIILAKLSFSVWKKLKKLKLEKSIRE